MIEAHVCSSSATPFYSILWNKEPVNPNHNSPSCFPAYPLSLRLLSDYYAYRRYGPRFLCSRPSSCHIISPSALVSHSSHFRRHLAQWDLAICKLSLHDTVPSAETNVCDAYAMPQPQAKVLRVNLQRAS